MRASTGMVTVAALVAAGCAQSGAPPSSSPERQRVSSQAAPPSPEAAPPRQTALHAAKKSKDATVIRVFYGTNRAASGSTEPAKFYGSDRGALQFGLCDVSIPPNHKTGELEAPSIWRLEFSENEKKHVILRSVEPTDGDRFLKELRSTISSSDGQEAFVFVHGYNVTFSDAARRTAQIAYDLRFNGAPIMFSWPAQGEFEDYTIDENSATWAAPQVTEFLEAVALSCGAKRIHLIAHSMGNRIVAQALEKMVREPSFGAVPEFNQVVLTAPDIDAEVFRRDIAPRIVQAAQRIVIYASSNDRALMASKKVHGYPRLGQAGEHLSLFPKLPKIEVVDASDADTSWFGLRHSYYATSDLVLTDLRRVFTGLEPGKRGLASQRNGQCWALKVNAVAGTAPDRQ